MLAIRGGSLSVPYCRNTFCKRVQILSVAVVVPNTADENYIHAAFVVRYEESVHVITTKKVCARSIVPLFVYTHDQ